MLAIRYYHNLLWKWLRLKQQSLPWFPTLTNQLTNQLINELTQLINPTQPNPANQPTSNQTNQSNHRQCRHHAPHLVNLERWPGAVMGWLGLVARTVEELVNRWLRMVHPWFIDSSSMVRMAIDGLWVSDGSFFRMVCEKMPLQLEWLKTVVRRMVIGEQRWIMVSNGSKGHNEFINPWSARWSIDGSRSWAWPLWATNNGWIEVM